MPGLCEWLIPVHDRKHVPMTRRVFGIQRSPFSESPTESLAEYSPNMPGRHSIDVESRILSQES